ncbi:MAG: S8 family serine peptidase [bacterium]
MPKSPATPLGTPARAPGQRNLQGKFGRVLVLSPQGVPDGTAVTVNGDLGKLLTGRPGPLVPGEYNLSVRHGGRLWFAECDVPAQQPGEPAIEVNLALMLVRETGVSEKRAGSHLQGPVTIVYIHGIGNKPRADVLRCQWDRALFDAPLGDRSRLAYWVDRNLYPTPEAGTCQGADMTLPGAAGMAARAASLTVPSDPQSELIAALARTNDQTAVLTNIASRLEAASRRVQNAAQTGQPSQRVLPGGKQTRRFLARWLTDLFLPDVHAYLFDEERREDMLDALGDRLRGGGEPFVVIGHSLGSVIAYDLLRRFRQEECNVALFLTIGSPLGMQEIRDHLKVGGRLAVPACVRRWDDFADEEDIVSIGELLQHKDGLERYYEANDQKVGVQTKWIQNRDRATNPHSGTGYLGSTDVRSSVRNVTGQAFGSRIVHSSIAGNLAAEADRGRASKLHEVLIQFDDSDDGLHESTLDEIAKKLIGKLEELARSRPATLKRLGEDPPERLRRFVAARLTRMEIDGLRTLAKELGVRLVWADNEKRALIEHSAAVVQARPAQLSYGATGAGIAWAVLDSGIDEGHTHFKTHKNIRAQWDCLTRHVAQLSGRQAADPNGHGTHVAGIIAGETRANGGRALLGMAPQTLLHGYRVLKKDGVGTDSAIIRALDHIARTNEAASRLVIHGVNLSLGSGYDPSIYGCGHTPLCQELRRLWRQGVIVVLAAGNEGHATVETAGSAMALNLDLSIGDPANLEEAIAVGSVHKTKPHTYGISYFSSRGPTADGRRKPDCVAPGENVLSARSGAPNGKGADPAAGFVAMSGTSMAAPHVSGVLAGFLSARREFIGQPDRLKEILLTNCTDLKRDPNMQGAGLVNLARMLLST